MQGYLKLESARRWVFQGNQPDGEQSCESHDYTKTGFDIRHKVQHEHWYGRKQWSEESTRHVGRN